MLLETLGILFTLCPFFLLFFFYNKIVLWENHEADVHELNELSCENFIGKEQEEEEEQEEQEELEEEEEEDEEEEQEQEEEEQDEDQED